MKLKTSQKADRWDRESLRVNLELTIDQPLLLVLATSPDEIAEGKALNDCIPPHLLGLWTNLPSPRVETVYSHGILKLRPDSLFERFDAYGEEVFSDFRSRMLKIDQLVGCQIYMAISSPNPEWWSIDPCVDCQYLDNKVLISATATGFSLEDYK
jgi:hypothetical protein